MDEDIIANWRDQKERSQEKRAANREASAKILTEAGARFEVKNGGAHLIVTAPNGTVYDFWPGTGLWTHRATRQQGRGVHSLIKMVKGGKA